MTDALAGFDRSTFTHGGETRTIYRTGSGPAVIVISEMPGITPDVADFARKVADRGLTAVLPHMFGEDGRAPTPRLHRPPRSPGPASPRSSPSWPGGRPARSSAGSGPWPPTSTTGAAAPGVGAVGMCFTGGFALGMMVDDVVVAPVLSQPSLPFPVSRAHRRDLGLSPEDADAGGGAGGGRTAASSASASPVTRLSPPERFEHLRELLGDAFVGVELDSSPGNPYGHKKAGPLGAHRGPRRPARAPRPGPPSTRSSTSSPSASRCEPPGRSVAGPRRRWRPLGWRTRLHRRRPGRRRRPEHRRPCSSSTASPPRRSTSTGWSTGWPPTGGSLLFDMLGYGLLGQARSGLHHRPPGRPGHGLRGRAGRRTGWVC